VLLELTNGLLPVGDRPLVNAKNDVGDLAQLPVVRAFGAITLNAKVQLHWCDLRRSALASHSRSSESRSFVRFD
jgi:hypothetical protein